MENITDIRDITISDIYNVQTDKYRRNQHQTLFLTEKKCFPGLFCYKQRTGRELITIYGWPQEILKSSQPITKVTLQLDWEFYPN